MGLQLKIVKRVCDIPKSDEVKRSEAGWKQQGCWADITPNLLANCFSLTYSITTVRDF